MTTTYLRGSEEITGYRATHQELPAFDIRRDDRFRLVHKLGWAFNTAVGLHIDAYPPRYLTRAKD